MRASLLRLGSLAALNLGGLAAFAWPFLVPRPAPGEGHGVDAPFLMVGFLLLLGALLLVELGRGGMGPKTVALVGVLGATMVALRLPGFVAGFSAMFIVVLVAGNAFGPSFGFVLGAVGTFASGLFVGGLGPWLPFQMIAVGWMGAGAGLLPRGGDWRARISALAVYGCVAGYLFGALINLYFWPFQVTSGPLGWSAEAGPATNLAHYVRFYVVTSAGWDTFRAIGNALLVVVMGRPLLGALDRAARRMHFELRAG